MEKKPKSETEIALSKYKAGHFGLKAASYVATVAPFAVELGVNWNEWFSNANDKPSIGIGLSMALVSTIASVTAVMKKDSESMKKFSPLVWIGALFLMWGITLLLLSQIANDMGLMLIYSALGIMGGAVMDEVDKTLVLPKYQLLTQVADENGLSKKGEYARLASIQAKRDSAKKYGRDNGTRI